MEYRKLGKTDLLISPIILGAWQYGCERYWGNVPDSDAFEVIAEAIDRGINTIDTAIGYDDSEIIVGKAIKNIRDKVIVVTKGGADPKKMPQWVDLSLKRMNLDYIDLYLVHYPDVDIPVEDTIGGMTEIRDAGKIRYIGVSNFSGKQLERAASVTDIACCQQAYNFMWREIEDTGTVRVCLENQIGILAYSPLGQGLFTGKIRSREDMPEREGYIRHITLLFQGDAFNEGLKLVDSLDRLSAKYNKTPAQITINWVIHQQGITAAIVGNKRVKQLTDNLAALGWKMEQEDYDRLSAQGSRISKLFDYSCTMFGMKYSEVKIDEMIDASLSFCNENN